MKINSVEFRNLASLAGTITIDFTAPEFQGNGLFLLSGATGAGKSTVLDAIALALYGRTPRLSNGTEIKTLISHGQTEYSSTVEFSIAEQIFQVSWICTRAYGRVSGRLQSPKHTLLKWSEEDKKFVFAADQSDVPKKIAEISGLNFERFTRTALLAQGKFADFLTASEAEKSDLLEQITGTEIYSQISQKVYDITQEKVSQRCAKESVLQALMPNLGTVEERELRLQRQQELENVRPKLSSDLKTLQTQRQDCEQAQNLSREMDALNKEKQTLDEEEQAFIPRAQRLTRGLLAEQLLRDHFTRLNEQRQNLTQLKKECQAKNAEMPSLFTAREEAVIRKQQAEKDLAQFANEYEELQKLLKTVRPLDGELLSLRRVAQDALAGQQQCRQQFAATKKAKDDNQARQKTANSDCERLGAWRANNLPDQSLVTDLGVCLKLLQDWQESAKQSDSLAKLSAEASERQQKAEQDYLAAQKLLQEADARQKQSEEELQKQTEAYQELLAGQSEEDCWRQEGELVNRHTCAADAKKAITALRLAKETCAAAQKNQELLGEKLNRAEEILSASQQKYEKQQELLTLARDIHNYQAVRRTLQDGQPCPLCGATEHLLERLPKLAVSEQEKALQSLLLELNAAQKERQLLFAQHSEAVGKLKQSQDSVDACRQYWLIGKDALVTLLALGPQELTLDSQAEQTLTKLLSELKDRQGQAQTHWRQLQAAKKNLALAEKACQAALKAYNHSSVASQTTASLAALEQERAGNAGKAAQEAQEREKNCQVKFAQIIVLYGETCSSPEQGQRSYTRLAKRLQEWNENSSKLSAAKTALQNLQAAEAVLQEQLQAATEACSLAENKAQQAQAALIIQETKRKEIFADRDCDNEETACKQRLDLAQQSFQLAKDHLSAAEEKLKTTQALYQQLCDKQESSAQAEKNGSTEAALALTELGFKNEDDYRLACLSTPEREKLQAEKDDLATKIASYRGRYEKTAAQNQEYQQRCSGLDYAAICEQAADLGKKIDVLNQELGSFRNQEQAWQAAQQKVQAVTTEILRLKEIEGQWQELNRLIGSKEGGKFRNIAQSITLDNVIARANEQLRIIMPRYELVRAEQDDPENKSQKGENRRLAINVIDDYLDGQERDTKNISGGETFVVSLALALGLSGLENTNLLVETLFLDEGFGSLDATSLEQALEALGKLRDDGRLIGIISHVEALKGMEPQIVIERQGNTGRSEIRGPGCSFKPPPMVEKKSARKARASQSEQESKTTA